MGQKTKVSVVRNDKSHTDQREVAAVSAHDLKDECSLMRVGCGNDVVCRLHNSVQGRVSSDRHVGSAEILCNNKELLLREKSKRSNV